MKNAGQSKVKNEVILAEQQEPEPQEHPAQEEQPEPQEQQQLQVLADGEKREENTTSSAPPAARKKRVRKGRQLTEAELMPRPSYWPFALAISLALALLGFVMNPIVLAIGILLVIVSISGWFLERR